MSFSLKTRFLNRFQGQEKIKSDFDNTLQFIL